MIPRLKQFLVPACGIVLPVSAQFSPSRSGSAATRADQLPLSGRAQGSSVTIGQTTAGAPGTGSVNTLNSTLQVQGNIQGSVPGNDVVSQQPLTHPGPGSQTRAAVQFERGGFKYFSACSERGKARRARSIAAGCKRKRARGRSTNQPRRRRPAFLCHSDCSPASRRSTSRVSSARTTTSTFAPVCLIRRTSPVSTTIALPRKSPALQA